MLGSCSIRSNLCFGSVAVWVCLWLAIACCPCATCAGCVSSCCRGRSGLTNQRFHVSVVSETVSKCVSGNASLSVSPVFVVVVVFWVPFDASQDLSGVQLMVWG
jgi:hypothetical protein